MFPLIDTLYIRNSPRNSLDITIESPDSDLLIEINLGEIDILLIPVFFEYSEQFISPKQEIYELPFFLRLTILLPKIKLLTNMVLGLFRRLIGVSI